MKGQLRELVVHDLLEPFLSPGCVIGSGEVVSAYGGTSNQIDVVIADRRILPPVLIRDAGIFPVEACLLTIEIKSQINATELQASHDSAKKLAGFHHAPPLGFQTHGRDPIEHIAPFLFAFSTDLAVGGKSEIDRYKEIVGDEPPAIRGLCVVDRGYWRWNNDIGWHEGDMAVRHAAVVQLVADIINISQHIARTRRQPDIREYLDLHHELSDVS